MVTRNYLPQVALDDPIRPLRMLAFRKDCPGHPFVSEGSEGGGGESGDSCSNDESIRAIINTLLLSSPMPSTTATTLPLAAASTLPPAVTTTATPTTPPPPPITPTSTTPTSPTSPGLSAWQEALDNLRRVKEDPKGVLKVLLSPFYYFHPCTTFTLLLLSTFSTPI